MRARSRRILGLLLAAAGAAPSAPLHAQDSAPPTATPTPTTTPTTTATATTTTTTTPTTTTTTPAEGGAPAPTPPAVGQRDRREAAREGAEDRLRAAVLPSSMSPERFAAFLAAIDPPLAANADLAAAFAAYAEETREAIEASASRIADRLPAAYTFDAGREEFVARPNPELVEVLTLRDKAAARIASAERALFRAIGFAIPDERRLRFLEERLAWLDERTVREGLLPSTRLSLLEIVARARLSSDAAGSVEPLLRAHAERLATLRETRIATLRDADMRRARIETAAGTLWRLGPSAQVLATDALLAKVDDDEFANELAIRDLHFETLGKLRARLPSREGRRVIEEWQRSVHPGLFDDERFLARLVEASIALPTSAPETDAAILDAVENAYRRLEPLARDASAAADLVLPRLLDRGDASVLAEIEARQSVLALQSKRRAAIRDLVSRVRSFVGGGEAAVAAKFTAMDETIAALERADAFDRSSLVALQAAILAHQAAREAQPADEGATPPPPTTPSTRQGGSAPAGGQPASQPTQSDTRPANGAPDTNAAGNRSGRGSRRQQSPSGNG
jgi:hypothetical protein